MRRNTSQEGGIQNRSAITARIGGKEKTGQKKILNEKKKIFKEKRKNDKQPHKGKWLGGKEEIN